jgi:signal transduction histidine kinase
MIAPAIPANEAERLQELYRYELLDSVYESEFTDIVQLASRICSVPISLITLVDTNRQWFKARSGLDVAETARNVSFCGHAIISDDIFEVRDAASDSRFFDNPLVTGNPNIRYYAGMPLVTDRGYKIGTLCVIDRVPRELDEEQTFAMKILSRQVIKLFELRVRNKQLNKITGVQQMIMTIMAHDIRGPLASLKTTYELKNDGAFSEDEIRELDNLVPLQMDSTVQLLNNIVDWGKLQLDDKVQRESLFNLHDLCRDSIGLLVLEANEKGNTFINTVDPLMIIKAAKSGIEFALRNLLRNANKFTSSGTITVSASLGDTHLEISVTDTGVGMAPEVMEALVSRTWSATTPGTNSEKGSGLGLKLIYEYLVSNNGNIFFYSNLGEGSRVVIVLPVSLE